MIIYLILKALNKNGISTKFGKELNMWLKIRQMTLSVLLQGHTLKNYRIFSIFENL